MEIRVTLKGRNERYHADGIYIDSKKFIVCKGSLINLNNDCIVSKKVQMYRNNPEIVDAQGRVLNDCEFGSPSIAAQFVNGTSTNGYIAWKIKKKTLRDYLTDINDEV